MSRSSRVCAIAAAATAALGLAVGAAAQGEATGSGKDASGHWDATLRYRSLSDHVFPRVSQLRLRVTRGGVVVYNRILPLPRECVVDGCSLLDGPGTKSFELRDLGLQSGPAAVIWLWTGGAHCCTIVHVVSMPDGRAAVRDFGDTGARIVKLGKRFVFRSADDRFAYLFTSFAASAFPVQLWRFADGRFTEVTRDFPDTIAADAAGWWKVVVKERAARGEVRGVFAAWAADECALGKSEVVAKELAAGVARGTFSQPSGEPGGLEGAGYAAALRLRLRQWGYCR